MERVFKTGRTLNSYSILVCLLAKKLKCASIKSFCDFLIINLYLFMYIYLCKADIF